MKQSVPETVKITPSLVFFLIFSMQIGVGVLSFQRIIVRTAGYDAWISVILAGLSIHLILWMMYKITATVDGDLVSAHIFILGEKLGRTVSALFILYFSLNAITILRSYIEVIQVWMFPEMSTFWFSFGFLVLVVYIVTGGLRTVTGVAFFSVVLTSYVFLTFAFTFQFANFQNLLPLFDHSVTKIARASTEMSLTYLGYEILFFIYPFIQEPQKSQKWAHYANAVTTLLYTGLAVITFAYFSEDQLKRNVWPTITMWKIFEMPFVERFEYIGITNWYLIILPNVCIAVWCASRLIKRTFHIRQRTGLIVIFLLCLISINYFRTRLQVDLLNTISSRIGLYLTYFYIPFLFIVIWIAKKVKKK